MQDPAIEVQNLWKSYGPNKLTFSVPRGAISGFLGPNGAGKTTTMRILMGFAHAEGTAKMLGVAAGSTHEIFRKVAFVPEIKDLYPYATAFEMIKLTRGFYPDWDSALEQQLIDLWEIPLRTRCPKLSKGTKGRLAILLAVCRRPELLVLDEPTDGLDPVATEDALRLLVEMVAERGATVFFSTHHLSEVEQIADHVVMIKRGQCVLQGELDHMRQTYRRVRCVLQDTLADRPVDLPLALAHWRREGRFLTGYSPEDAETLHSKLEGSGIEVLESEPASLKEIFLEQMERV